MSSSLLATVGQLLLVVVDTVDRHFFCVDHLNRDTGGQDGVAVGDDDLLVLGGHDGG